MKYYKVARADGFDFHTGKTINYRKNIGKIVKVKSRSKNYECCSSSVIHASKEFLHALSYGEFPYSIYVVEGKPVVKQDDKYGFTSFKVIREIPTKNWKQTYYKFMIYMLEDTKNNFYNKKEKQVTDAINQVIQVFVNAKKSGDIDESAARSAWYATRSAAESAGSTWSAWSAARSAGYAVRSAAESATRYAAESAGSTGSAAEFAVWSAKFKEYSEKFIEFLEKTKRRN